MKLNKNTEKAMLKIINKYGLRHQLKYIQSEFFEFTESVIEYDNMIKNKDKMNFTDQEIAIARNHMIEEMSDVFVMMNEFKLFYEVPDGEIIDWMDFKANRENKRMLENNK